MSTSRKSPGYVIVVIMETDTQIRPEVSYARPDNNELIMTMLKTIDDLKNMMIKETNEIPRIVSIEVYDLGSKYTLKHLGTRELDLIVDQILDDLTESFLEDEEEEEEI